MVNKTVNIVGGGLAGCEAAWQIASCKIPVNLYEMRPSVSSPAHNTQNLAELVCSNSFRSNNPEANAVGVLQEELRRGASLLLQCADETKVPAGGALAVDRLRFSEAVEAKLLANPFITIKREEVTKLPDADDELWILACGPLASPKIAAAIGEKTGLDFFYFFDAIAPLVYTESIDLSKAWCQSRYDKGDSSDYINCPLSKEEYYNFIDELLKAEKVTFKDWEKPDKFFEGCLPIEVMAERGIETLAFGPMKPVGLVNPHKEEQPYAVVQLRQDNMQDSLRNIVGFQTKLKHNEQKRIFKMIPGLENAEFARLGNIHRNSFINSPQLLDSELRLKQQPNIRFAGQISGCEGYVESIAMGFLAGIYASAEIKDIKLPKPDITTAIGALHNHVVNSKLDNFEPMNVNFGLFAEIEPEITPKGKLKHFKGKERKAKYAQRALENIDKWYSEIKQKLETE
ncbi:MAG: methylenetetrahydrofolate--tRNA-(uracil(54)-C(5))-methyltransferase (FADH(2)-oxidizing) TrmFO [Alphaproteobacteria bacterium]